MKFCAGLLILVPFMLGGCGSSQPQTFEETRASRAVTPTPTSTPFASGENNSSSVDSGTNTSNAVATAEPSGVKPLTTNPSALVKASQTVAVSHSRLNSGFDERNASNPNFSDKEKAYMTGIRQALTLVDSAINRMRAGGDANTALAEITQAKAFFTQMPNGPDRFASAHPLFTQGVSSIFDGITKWKDGLAFNSTYDVEQAKNLIAQGTQTMNSGMDMMGITFQNSPLKLEENGYINSVKLLCNSVVAETEKIDSNSLVNPDSMDTSIAEIQRLAREARGMIVPARFATSHRKFVQGIDTIYGGVVLVKMARTNLDKNLLIKAANQLGAGGDQMSGAMQEIGQTIIDSTPR